MAQEDALHSSTISGRTTQSSMENEVVKIYQILLPASLGIN